MAFLRSFFGFLHDDGTVAQNPAQKIAPPVREHWQPRVLTEGKYKRLLDAVRHETRDAAIVEVRLRTGIRLSGLACLTLSDVELPAKINNDQGNVGSIRVYGKGRKERTIAFNWKACKAVKSYQAVRPKLDNDRLFITKFGQGMSPRAIHCIVEKYLREAGIQDASVHTPRHTFATHMVKKGTMLDVVRQALAHESSKTTSIYVDLARELMDKELQQNAL